jgi:GH24 family phage-related lysozyme (muramidase)
MSLPDWFVNEIKKREGFKNRAYWDHGQWSVGYGSRAKSSSETIDQGEANRRLLTELADARQHVEGVAPKDAPEGAKLALTSLTHNAGTKWTNDGLGEYVRQGNWPAAAARMQMYVKSQGQTMSGLATRRAAEADLMMGRRPEAPGYTPAQPPASAINPQTTPEANWPGATPQPPGAPAQPAAAPAASSVPSPGSQAPPRPPADIPAGRSMAGVNPRLVAAVQGGAQYLPQGYTIRATSGQEGRTDPRSYHTKGMASDWEIIGPDGKAIANKGEDSTGMYTLLARGVRTWTQQNDPEIAGKIGWGGAFGTQIGGGGVPDLMHFDLGGSRGRMRPDMQFAKLQPLDGSPTQPGATQVASAAPSGAPSPFPPPPGAPAGWPGPPTDVSAARRQPGAAAPRAAAPRVAAPAANNNPLIRMHSGGEDAGPGQPMGTLMAPAVAQPRARAVAPPTARAEAPRPSKQWPPAPPTMSPSPEKLNELGLSPPTGNVQAPVFNEPDGAKPGMYPPMSPMSSEMGSVMPPGQMDWTGPSMTPPTPPFGQGQQPLNPAPETLASMGIMPGSFGGSAFAPSTAEPGSNDATSPLGAVSKLMPSPAPGFMVGKRLVEPSGPTPPAPDIADRLASPDRFAPPGGILSHDIAAAEAPMAPRSPGPINSFALASPELQPREWQPPQQPQQPPLPWQEELKQRIGLAQYGPQGRAQQQQQPQQQPQQLAYMPGQVTAPNWWDQQNLPLSPFLNGGFGGGGGGGSFPSFGGGDW